MNQTITNNTGWVCPKCGQVHAPWVSQCYCMGLDKTYYEYPSYEVTSTPNETVWINSDELYKY